ncbi:unnamed protein product [Linum tenue]|uniref:Uncharacterized protein n=1 Tax=Linum tenue TaxID=586396 RepID=A0AAV0IFU2_9ROSI|nr:unnamed protein product [Linum tenue]
MCAAGATPRSSRSWLTSRPTRSTAGGTSGFALAGPPSPGRTSCSDTSRCSKDTPLPFLPTKPRQSLLLLLLMLLLLQTSSLMAVALLPWTSILVLKLSWTSSQSMILLVRPLSQAASPL